MPEKPNSSFVKTLAVTLPGGKPQTHELEPGEAQRPLSAILLERGVPISLGCGGNGICTNCRVTLTEGTVHEEGPRKTRDAGPGDTVRSCRSLGTSKSVAIEVPARSLIGTVESQDELPLGQVEAGAVPLAEGPVACFDIGTTTVALALVEAKSQEVLFRATCFNRQIGFGSDVMSRIDAARVDPANLTAMQHAVVAQSFAPLLHAAEKQGHRLPVAAVATGNPTMMHLLAAESTDGLATFPFETPFLAPRTLDIRGAGGEMPFNEVHLLPAAGPYFGSDLVAGAYALGLHRPGPLTLFLDLGTNGEMMLTDGERTLATSTAAGPAFEGRGLQFGMKAVPGAIRSVRAANGELEFESIGKMNPLGVCGTGYLDFIAAGRELGLLDEMGKFADHPNVRDDEYGRKYLFNPGAEEPVAITELDIAALLQAKAAVAAATRVLLDQSELDEADIERFIVAGGFGQSIKQETLRRVGLIPDLPNARFEAIGNSSLAGAVLAAYDTRAHGAMHAYAQGIQMIELNLVPEFEDEFIDGLSLP